MIQYLESKDFNLDIILIAGDIPKTTPFPLMIEYMIKHPLKFLSKSEYTRWVYKGNGRKKFVKEQIKSINQVLDLLKKLNTPIVYVPGNVDTKELNETFKSRKDIELHYLDGEILDFGKISILGIGGSLFTPNKYSEPLCEREYSFEDFKNRLSTIKIPSMFKNDYKILLTHEPPSFEIRLKDRIFKGGASFFSDIITNKGINLSIFGHWHEFPIYWENPDSKTLYINPGPLGCYYFSILEKKDRKVEIKHQKLVAEKFDITNIIYSLRKESDMFLKTLRFV